MPVVVKERAGNYQHEKGQQQKKILFDLHQIADLHISREGYHPTIPTHHKPSYLFLKHLLSPEVSQCEAWVGGKSRPQGAKARLGGGA
jgi:hypothetical protein